MRLYSRDAYNIISVLRKHGPTVSIYNSAHEFESIDEVKQELGGRPGKMTIRGLTEDRERFLIEIERTGLVSLVRHAEEARMAGEC